MMAPATPAMTTVRGFQSGSTTCIGTVSSTRIGIGVAGGSGGGGGTGTASGEGDDKLPTLAPPKGAPSTRPSTPSSQRRGRFPVDDIVSANCSPSQRPQPSPAMSGITKLRLQMVEPLSLDTPSRAASLSRPASRSNLNSGFVSRDGGLVGRDGGGGGSLAMSRTASRDGGQPLSRRASRISLNGGQSLSRRASRINLNGGQPLPRTVSRDGGQPLSRTASRDGIASVAASDEYEDEGSTSYEIDLKHDFADESAPDPAPATLERRKMTAEDFEPLRCLGKGAYGTVLLVKQRATGRLYAQKQFKKASLVVHKKLVEQTKTERQILESVNQHPFVVKLYYAFQDHEKLYLILEYGQGGELFHHLDSERMFSESVAAFYMAEMMLAISHLHDNLGVVYRDLKPENCLLDADGHLLLTDFGLSKVSAEPTDSCNSILGTVEYMAPEVVQGKKYGRPADWWSFGALAYDLMTGTPPFRGGNNAKIQENIVKQKLYLPYFLSPDAKDLLTRLMRKDPSKRLGGNMPRDLTTLRRHRVFRNIDWRRLEARELDPPIRPLITDPELAENFSPEFTELAMSPVVPASGGNRWGGRDDPFGGFSFVAPSLLEREVGGNAMGD